MTEVRIRAALPSDHPRIQAVCDHWWGRPISHILPRLYLDHFHTTSLIADKGEDLAGFIIGFHSPSDPDAAYIHLAGVAPGQRRSGLASDLYRQFTETARVQGRSVVRAITSPGNEPSIAFHRAFGFDVSEPHADYDGPGVHRVVFALRL